MYLMGEFGKGLDASRADRHGTGDSVPDPRAATRGRLTHAARPHSAADRVVGRRKIVRAAT